MTFLYLLYPVKMYLFLDLDDIKNLDNFRGFVNNMPCIDCFM